MTLKSVFICFKYNLGKLTVFLCKFWREMLTYIDFLLFYAVQRKLNIRRDFYDSFFYKNWGCFIFIFDK